MPVSRTIALPEKLYESLTRIGGSTSQTPEQVALKLLNESVHQFDDDPLLQLLGCIESDLKDVAERHDEYIGRRLRDETPGESHG
jgi:hypothetical protein